MHPFRPRAPGAETPMRAPNIRNRTVCRFCVHCNRAVSTTWERCRFEYCGQQILNGQYVPMPPAPNGWSACLGCKCVFIKDGQRFCGLCNWSTPAGAAYTRLLTQQIRGLMNQQEAIKNLLNPVAGPVVNPPLQPVPVVHQPIPGIPAPHPIAAQEEDVFADVQIEDMLLADE